MCDARKTSNVAYHFLVLHLARPHYLSVSPLGAGRKVFVECLSHHRSVLGRILSISLLSLTRDAVHATL